MIYQLCFLIGCRKAYRLGYKAVNAADFIHGTSIVNQGSFHRGSKPSDVLITHKRFIINKGVPESVVWIKPDKLATASGDCIYFNICEFVRKCFGMCTMPTSEVKGLVDELKALNYPSGNTDQGV